jgi:NodT family efflux transporter outer membrane factor (OMF) lipoprotein
VARAQYDATVAGYRQTVLTSFQEVEDNLAALRILSRELEEQNDAVASAQRALSLSTERYKSGIDSYLNVITAQATDLGIARSQFEHAIAVLTGQPPAAFSLPNAPLVAQPPSVPVGLPSQLLERRPDVAAAERRVAEANAEIGVTRAAFFPSLVLSATGGFESTSIASWFTWPARFFSLGPTLSQTLFDKGRRKAATEVARAQYDATVAGYRQTVLTSFQEVEDNLAALRILSRELEEQNDAVASAQRALSLSTERYKSGIDSYLNVITAQATLLSNQRTAVNLQMQQMTASVELIKALGGGWNASELPTQKQLKD